MEKQRLAYLDWIRIISIVIVLLFHSAMFYMPGVVSHIKNQQTSSLLVEADYFFSIYRMPLLFFTSGTVSYYMMMRRTTFGFIIVRCRRLLIPLIAGMIIVVLPQLYIFSINEGNPGGVKELYRLLFTMLRYRDWHHLWFIAYLFIYDLLFAPLFAWLLSPAGAVFKQKIGLLSSKKLVFLMALPGVIWFTLLSGKFPQTRHLNNDLCFFVYYLFFLMAGFICIIQPKLMDSLERNRKFCLTLSFLGTIFLYALRWNNQVPVYEQASDLSWFAFSAFNSIIAWACVFAFIGYGKRYLNHQPKILDYLNPGVFPFYILHKLVLVVLAYYIVRQLGNDVLVKYIFTVSGTFVVTFGIYHLLIKPYALPRFLFGMKSKSETKPSETTIPETINEIKITVT